MEWIRKANGWEGGRDEKTEIGRTNCEWVDWLPWSLRCAAANYAAAPVGMTTNFDAWSGWKVRGRVSEWGTGLELMQEWKFGLKGKASVCKGIWKRENGTRPAIKGE